MAVAAMRCGHVETHNHFPANQKSAVPPSLCDTILPDKPAAKDVDPVYRVHLEFKDIDWFLRYRQSIWRQAIAWLPQTPSLPIAGDSLLQCMAQHKRGVFLYIPNKYHEHLKNGNECIHFLLVNNSPDTLPIPCIDATIDHIGSSVSATGQPERWVSYQETSGFIECGNSFWTMKLPPYTALRANLDSHYMNAGDTLVNYRINMQLGKDTIVSNTIQAYLLKKQIPYLGSEVDW